jgi:ribokinase
MIRARVPDRLPVPGPVRPGARQPRARQPRVIVVGDLLLDVVLKPSRPLDLGTDVPGSVALRQGGSAATTARWLARLGARVALVCAVGRDGPGRALIEALEADRVRVRAVRVAGERTGRIGVIVGPGGERSFVADRRAADRLRPEDLDASTFAADLLHVPAYTLLAEPLAIAGRRAIALARDAGALVSLDLASVGPLLARGRTAALRLVREAAPDVLFATAVEAEAILGRPELGRIVDLAPLAVVKRGRAGASVLARDGRGVLTFDVATPHLETADTTGAGDAFDAGFLVTWLSVPAEDRFRPTALRRTVLAANRAAARQLATPPKELSL